MAGAFLVLAGVAFLAVAFFLAGLDLTFTFLVRVAFTPTAFFNQMELTDLGLSNARPKALDQQELANTPKALDTPNSTV